jgi:hypothetical protein
VDESSLAAIYAKLERADEHLKALTSEIGVYVPYSRDAAPGRSPVHLRPSIDMRRCHAPGRTANGVAGASLEPPPRSASTGVRLWVQRPDGTCAKTSPSVGDRAARPRMHDHASRGRRSCAATRRAREPGLRQSKRARKRANLSPLGGVDYPRRLRRLPRTPRPQGALTAPPGVPGGVAAPNLRRP